MEADKSGPLVRNKQSKRSDIKSCDKPVEKTMFDMTMTDAELINKSIKFLSGKGFSVSI